MKSILHKLSKRATAGIVAVLLIAGLSGTVLATFGPSRPTKAWSPTVEGFDHVTFNSFTGVGNGVGDEQDFFRGVQVGRDSVWSDPVANVTQDAEVEGKIYIHNNADASLNTVPDGNGGFKGVAKNVTVKVAMPTGSNRSQDVTAFIAADNAQPQQIFDTLTMTGANNGYFELAYEPGTAQLHKGGATVTLTAAQEQALLGNGYNTGDQNGCFDFVQEITFRMKVKMPRYTITKQVALPGETNWRENVDVKPGDTVSWLVTFTNTGKTDLKSVKMVDEVPSGLTVVPGTVKLTNGNYPNGYIYPDSAIQANGRQVNVDLGNYNPGILAYLSYRTKVADDASLACGLNTFTNKAFTTPEGYGAIWDTATATATRTCTPTTPTTPTTPKPAALPNTGPGDVMGVFSAITVAGGVAHRAYASRRRA